jgi:hypothetical protein
MGMGDIVKGKKKKKPNYNEVIIHFRLLNSAASGDLIDHGSWGTCEHLTKNCYVITTVSDAAIGAHEMGHVLEALYGFPADLEIPETLEDTMRAIQRKYTHSENGHNS